MALEAVELLDGPAEVRNRFDEIEPTGRIGHVHVRWWSRYLARAIPVMEADLSVRALANGRSQLVLDGECVPPLGALGMVGDVLVGRRVARSTAQALLDRQRESRSGLEIRSARGGGTRRPEDAS